MRQNFYLTRAKNPQNKKNVHFLIEVGMESAATLWIMIHHGLLSLKNNRNSSSDLLENYLKDNRLTTYKLRKGHL